MSALGQKQTRAVQNPMSALHPKVDICSAQADVRFVPIADIASAKVTRQRTAHCCHGFQCDGSLCTGRSAHHFPFRAVQRSASTPVFRHNAGKGYD